MGYEKLFKLMNETLGITPTQTEMSDFLCAFNKCISGEITDEDQIKSLQETNRKLNRRSAIT